MNHYVYDGSFSGLLTVYYTLLKNNEGQRCSNLLISPQQRLKMGLFSEPGYIETDEKKVEEVYNFIKKRLTPTSLKRIYYAFLSEIEGIESVIYQYLLLGFKLGRKLDNFLGNDIVYRICEVSRKVGYERHRLLGLLRFKKIKGDIYYATLEPDYNIVTLLAPHFAARLRDQKWIIHDLKREIGTIYQQGEWYLVEIKRELEYNCTLEEGFYQELWKGFFQSIAIKSRKNPRLQKQYMPERYWKHLVEKN